MDLNLNCADIYDNGEGISIPPKNAKQYPVKVGVKALREYIEKGGEILVIPVENTKNLEVEEYTKE